MALRAVRQENTTGCFIAAIATLLGKSYHETFMLLHPGKNPLLEDKHGFLDMSVERAAFGALKLAGIKAHRSSLKRFRSFTRHSKHALLIIRWSFAPDLCHTIIYDGGEHRFIDPTWGGYIQTDTDWEIKRLANQFDFGIIIDQLPKEQNESQRRLGDGSQLP